MHAKIKYLKDKQNLISRKSIISALKYRPKLDKRIRDIIIKELCEMGLLVKVNRDTYKWIPNKKSEMIEEKLKVWSEYKGWWQK